MSEPLRLRGISRLVTNVPGDGPLGIIEDAVVDLAHGEVAWVGEAAAAPRAAGEVLDVEGRAVMPGFVDPHTHLVFEGDRAEEFAMRMAGATYSSIQASGGGIMATVAATRQASTGALFEAALARVTAMFRAGTTTVEIKSGYGLTADSERRILEVAARIGEESPVDVVPTFLGAHAIPPGIDRAGFVRQVVEDLLPACAPLARFIDVFCDEGAFTLDETRVILEEGVAAGLRPRLHAEQLAFTGAAQLAAEFDAASADHLDHLTEEGAEAMAQHGVVAVLLPGAALSMRSGSPPYRLLKERGVTVALATDCNPGTSYWLSMQSMVTLAVGLFGMDVEDAIWSATRGGALALEDSRKGIVTPRATADLIVLDTDDPVDLAYRPDTNHVAMVIKDGVRAL